MNFGLRPLLVVLALGLAAPAMAARDMLLVLDNSGSMRRNDPQRLAPPAVTAFIKAQPPDTRVGVIVFDTDARLVLPLTLAVDAAGAADTTIRQHFTYNGRLTRTAQAVERALYELRSEGRPGASRAIVLMTDGLVDAGNAQKSAEMVRWLRQDLAAQAKADGVRIFGIAFTEQADYELLQALASTTGAEYYRVLDPDSIGKALERLDSVMLREPAKAAAPAPAAEPAVPATSTVVVTPPPVAKPRSLNWVAWALGLVGLLLPVIGWLAWQRYRPRPEARDDTSEFKIRRDTGPVGVLFDTLERHELGARPVVIGRASGNDPERYYIVVPEKTVGRWHATIERRGQTFWVRDEGSVNGTFLNGERVVGERPLKHRDTLRVHSHAFEFEIPELADADRTVMQPNPRLPLN